MNNLYARIGGRKFLLALAAAIAAIADHNWAGALIAAGPIAAFILGEAHIDASRLKADAAQAVAVAVQLQAQLAAQPAPPAAPAIVNVHQGDAPAVTQPSEHPFTATAVPLDSPMTITPDPATPGGQVTIGGTVPFTVTPGA